MLFDHHGTQTAPCLWRMGFAVVLWMFLGTAAVARGRPAWVADPKTEDSVHLYSLGHAKGMQSAQAAEEAAHRDARLRILRTHRSDIENPDRWRMEKVAVVPGCTYHEQDLEGHSCWVQIMWPKSERSNLVEQITAADLAEQQWQQARALAAEGRPSEGRILLEKLLAEQAETETPVRSPFELQMEIARSWHAENRPLEARRWYERIIHQAPEDPLAEQAVDFLEQLPPPPRLWPLNARFAGGPVALVAALGESDDWQPYRELARTLAQEFRDAGLETLDRARALGRALPDVIEEGEDMLAGAEASSASVALLVAVRTDPAKRGATTTAFGASLPVADTRVLVRVTDAQQGDVLYEESFPAIAGTRSRSALAEHVAHVMIQNHLLPHCPGLKRDLPDPKTATRESKPVPNGESP